MVKEWSTSLVSSQNRALLLRTRPSLPLSSKPVESDAARSAASLPSPRLQLEPLDFGQPESLEGAGATIFDRKSPR